ncbi:hypothetical protein YC2023_083722 [Brassica napus]
MEEVLTHLTKISLSLCPNIAIWDTSGSGQNKKFSSGQIYNLIREQKPKVPWKNLASIYELWRERNNRLHRKVYRSSSAILSSIKVVIKNRIFFQGYQRRLLQHHHATVVCFSLKGTIVVQSSSVLTYYTSSISRKEKTGLVGPSIHFLNISLRASSPIGHLQSPITLPLLSWALICPCHVTHLILVMGFYFRVLLMRKH